MNGHRHQSPRPTNAKPPAPGKSSHVKTSFSNKQSPQAETRARPTRIYYPETPSSDGSMITYLGSPSVIRPQIAPGRIKPCQGLSPDFPGWYGPTVRALTLSNPANATILKSRLERLFIAQVEAEKEADYQRVINMKRISRFRKVREWLKDPENHHDASSSGSLLNSESPSSSGHSGTVRPQDQSPSSSISKRAKFGSPRLSESPVDSEDPFIITESKLKEYRRKCGYVSMLLTYLAQ